MIASVTLAQLSLCIFLSIKVYVVFPSVGKFELTLLIKKISLHFCRNVQMLLLMVFCISDLSLDKCCFIPPCLHSASA